MIFYFEQVNSLYIHFVKLQPTSGSVFNKLGCLVKIKESFLNFLPSFPLIRKLKVIDE